MAQMKSREERMLQAARWCLLVTFLGGLCAVASGADPCCGISAIDGQRGVVTAKETATNRTFQFQVEDRKLLLSLIVGQGVYANFTTKKVSLNGQTACCEIISVGAAPSVVVPSARLETSKTLDPCAFASAAQIKVLLAAGLAGKFPVSMNKEGKHFKVETPTILDATCPGLRISARAHVQFRETRGFPQYETGGTLEFTSPISGKIEYYGPPGSPVQTSNFVSATACLTDIHITSLQIDRLPGWLDTTWLRQCFNGDHADWGCRDIISSLCFDVSGLVKLYLQQGRSL
jgi:hypothetical protein